MLSRIADSLYWLDRYLERTDGILRILRTEYVLGLDKNSDEYVSWRPALDIFCHLDEEKLKELENDTTATLRFFITDTENANSMKVLLTRARENARGAQDHITKEVWEQVNALYHFVHSPKLEKKLTGDQPLALLDTLTEMVTLYNGVTHSTMPRSAGWSFMNLGKYTERGLITLELSGLYLQEIGYNLNDNKDILHWRSLLLSLSGYELHLKTYRTSHHTRNVADQVLFNRDFTRSIRYTLHKLRHYMRDVLAHNHTPEKDKLALIFGRLHSKLEYADTALVAETGVDKFMLDIRHDLLQFNKLLTQIFFSYS